MIPTTGCVYCVLWGDARYFEKIVDWFGNWWLFSQRGVKNRHSRETRNFQFPRLFRSRSCRLFSTGIDGDFFTLMKIADSRSSENHALLISRNPIVFNPELAQLIGLNNAIVLQKLQFLLREPRNGKDAEGHRWIYNTYEEWQKECFPFWSITTIQRVFSDLEEKGLVRSIQPEGRASRRKYYRVDGYACRSLFCANLPPSEDSNLARSEDANETRSEDANLEPSLETKNTAKNTTKRPPPTSSTGKPLFELFRKEETQNTDPRFNAKAIMELWNDCPCLTPIRSISKKRHTAFMARLKDPFFNDNWDAAIRKMGASDFCTGKNDRGWKADFEFFLRPDSVLKIMEGKYDNKTCGRTMAPSKWDEPIHRWSDRKKSTKEQAL